MTAPRAPWLDALADTLAQIERQASYDRGHPTFDAIAALARQAQEQLREMPRP